jgi:formate dehydrogenase maturation protein FdhE
MCRADVPTENHSMERSVGHKRECPVCGLPDLMKLSMVLGGETIRFNACNFCEWKEWTRQGEGLPLSSVFGLASTR